MDYNEYKQLHSAAMANNSGGPIWETVVLLSPVPMGIFLSQVLAQYLPSVLTPFVEFTVIILSLVLSLTILSSNVFFIPLLYLILIFIFYFKLSGFKKVLNVLNEVIPHRKNCITNYRASTNMVSVVAILAVDFVVFPRRYAKTENFGYGLMDLGVGFFVCCNGMVVRDLKSSLNFLKVIKGSSPLIILGFIRLITTKAVDYNEHVSEYGVHWNFFFTLAFCKILACIVMSCATSRNPAILTIVACVTHELILQGGLKDWVFSNTLRTSVISANKEGITSILGYVSLYFASVTLGRIINTSKEMTYLQLIIKLSCFNVISWVFCLICEETIGVSRKLANTGFNAWIISLTVSKLIQFLIVEVLILSCFRAKNKGTDYCVPKLFEAINKNGLFFFLLANIVTGIINMSCQTLLMGSVASVLIISSYISFVCFITYVMHLKDWAIKVW